MESASMLGVRLEPNEPDYSHAFDIDQVYLQRELQGQGLCTTNQEAFNAHKAVFDAESDYIVASASERKSRVELGKKALNLLKQEATKHCMQCQVKEVCKDYALSHVRLDVGIMGGMTGGARKHTAKARGVSQQGFSRLRGKKIAESN